MEDIANQSAQPDAPATPWIQFLDRELSQSTPEDVENGLCQIFRHLFTSPNASAATEAAQQVDGYYRDVYLPSDPFLKFLDDKGTAGFLNTLYELVFDLARVVPYDHEQQQLLVQFLIELVKLPTREVKIWDRKCLVYANEPIFGSVMEDNWNGSYPSDMFSSDAPAIAESFKEWVNLSAFLARCIQSGRNDCFENWDKYPGVDIRKGLEETHEKGPRRDCLQLVAIQYLLLAGEKLHGEMIVRHADGAEKRQWGLGKWQLWAEKLQDIEEGQEEDFDLGQAAKRARQMMVSLEPSIQPKLQDPSH
ncbi:hypothetical protein CSUB01_03007 [Colletotrichum sublineola]|uniref:Uncharacterized protein n=1 Tax=Colletotrichum sublineola TaxID=1173701 RepID=A0A066XGP8_COLSU|nr:hypothetical protein CSUB01_03007 [Colletotrichum sublineola]